LNSDNNDDNKNNENSESTYERGYAVKIETIMMTIRTVITVRVHRERICSENRIVTIRMTIRTVRIVT